MFKLDSKRLPSPRYFVTYSAAARHARELGLSKRAFTITPESAK